MQFDCPAKTAEPLLSETLPYLLPKVEKFPRAFRFSVADRTVEVGLDLLLTLVESAFITEEAQPLVFRHN